MYAELGLQLFFLSMYLIQAASKKNLISHRREGGARIKNLPMLQGKILSQGKLPQHNTILITDLQLSVKKYYNH